MFMEVLVWEHKQGLARVIPARLRAGVFFQRTFPATHRFSKTPSLRGGKAEMVWRRKGWLAAVRMVGPLVEWGTDLCGKHRRNRSGRSGLRRMAEAGGKSRKKTALPGPQGRSVPRLRGILTRGQAVRCVRTGVYPH